MEDVAEWPPADVIWRSLALDAASCRILESEGASVEAECTFDTHGQSIRFDWTVNEDLDVIGSMALELFIEIEGGGDASLFVGVHKVHCGYEDTFEGSFGYPHDMVSKGWLRVAHRELEASLSSPERPTYKHDRAVPLAPGKVVPVRIALREHATRFRKGDVLQVEVRGTWLFRTKQFGHFCAFYEPGPKARVRVYTGPHHRSNLLLATRPLH